jgi:hypothetical protein
MANLAANTRSAETETTFVFTVAWMSRVLDSKAKNVPIDKQGEFGLGRVSLLNVS